MKKLAVVLILLAVTVSVRAETIRGNWSGQTTPTLRLDDGSTRTLYSYIAEQAPTTVTVSGNFSRWSPRYVAGPWPPLDRRHYRPRRVQFPDNAILVDCNFTNAVNVGGTAAGHNNFTLRVNAEETTTQTLALLADDGTTITYKWMGHRNRIFRGGNGIDHATPKILDAELPEHKRVRMTRRVGGVVKTGRITWASFAERREAKTRRKELEALPEIDE